MNRQILITVLLFVMMGCRQPESINCNLIFIGDSISEGIGVENPMEESAPAVAGNLMKESGMSVLPIVGRTGLRLSIFCRRQGGTTSL